MASPLKIVNLSAIIGWWIRTKRDSNSAHCAAFKHDKHLSTFSFHFSCKKDNMTITKKIHFFSFTYPESFKPNIILPQNSAQSIQRSLERDKQTDRYASYYLRTLSVNSKYIYQNDTSHATSHIIKKPLLKIFFCHT